MARIIVADDDVCLQRIYFYMLDGLGHHTTVCCNGQEALEAFKRQGADLVILDIAMPIMSGLEACRAIKQLPEGVNTPVIMVSGNDQEDEITQGFNAGADDYLVKPIQENVLVAKLKNFLKTYSLNKKEFELVKNHTVLLDRYRIGKVLGYGAHSMVFLAADQQENRTVAVKLLNQQVSEQSVRKYFVDMVTRYQQVQHPQLARIFDHGIVNNQLYLVMEYADGGNLRQRLTVKHFSEDEVCDLGLQMVSALEALSAHGLTHLDIKPENILLHQGAYRLTDFGLILPKESGTMPLQAELWSTAAYVCPEYLEGIDEPTIQSDIYSLGLTLFETVTGDNPFFSGRSTVSMFRQVNLVPPYLSNQTTEISYELSDVIAAMMSKNPADRPDLNTLQQWFTFIHECHTRNLAGQQLRYPRRREQQQRMAAQESAVKSQSFLPAPRLKSWPERQFERLGHAIYQFIMLREHRGIIGKIVILKKIVYAAMVMVTFTYLTYTALASLHFRPDHKGNAPICRLACTKCGNLADRRVMDIHTEKCERCGKPMGYALQCRRCHRTFAWFKPEIPADAADKTKQNMLKRSMSCPYCRSQEVSVLPPLPQAKPPQPAPAVKEKERKKK